MGFLSFFNHFNATLATSIGSSDTVLTLNLTDSYTPAIPSDSRMPLTLLDSTNPAAFEVVYCTAATGTQFTVIRAMESTTAISWSAGISVIGPPTGGSQQLLTQAGYAPPWSSTIATQIGGYQLNALVQDSSGVLWRSTAADNYTQPGTLNATWVFANSGAVPVGSVLDFCGTTAPDGWVLAYGQAVSRTTYAALFAVLGTLYGAGDGSTTFNLPDCRGRALIGQDNMGGAAAGRVTSASGITATSIAATGGNQSTQAHNHGINDPGHFHAVFDPTHAHEIFDPGHTHVPGQGAGFVIPQGQAGNENANFSGGGGTPEGTCASTAASGTHASIVLNGTGIGVESNVTSITTVVYGAGSSQNMPPVLVVSKIIYTGVLT